MATTLGFGVLLVLVFLAFGAVKVRHFCRLSIHFFWFCVPFFSSTGLHCSILLQVVSKVRGWKEDWDAVRAPKQDNNLYYGLYYR